MLVPKFIPSTKAEFDTLALLLQQKPRLVHPEAFMKMDESAYALRDEKNYNIMLKVIEYKWGPSPEGTQMSRREIVRTRHFEVEYE